MSASSIYVYMHSSAATNYIYIYKFNRCKDTICLYLVSEIKVASIYICKFPRANVCFHHINWVLNAILYISISQTNICLISMRKQRLWWRKSFQQLTENQNPSGIQLNKAIRIQCLCRMCEDKILIIIPKRNKNILHTVLYTLDYMYYTTRGVEIAMPLYRFIQKRYQCEIYR